MMIDEVTITVKAGNGGDGAVSFRRSEGNPRGGPDGGNGGNGGNVYVKGVNDLTALRQFQYKKLVKAEDGVPGKRKNLFGKNAEDLIVPIPVGTRILDESGEELVEIQDTDTRYLLARGGKGGRGNNEFKTAVNQAPRYAEKGEPGEEKVVKLEMRLIAQIGLVGLPNAGKSTLLSVLTNAEPKIGDYPFTTLEPNIGMLNGIMIADIPGLIEGASRGKGLGIKFLKHVEKTQLLVHCIDANTTDPAKVYETVRSEFGQYNEILLTKPEVILLTKSDTVDEETLASHKEKLRKIKREIYTVSVYDDHRIEEFRQELLTLYKEVDESPAEDELS